MLCGTIPISIVGTNYAMSQRPFWQPDQYSGLRHGACFALIILDLLLLSPCLHPCSIIPLRMSHPASSRNSRSSWIRTHFPCLLPCDFLATRILARSTHTVPILGMILGNAISAIGIAINSIQREFTENRDKIETYLAFGATRFEACKPVGVEALKLALLPTVNQLRSVYTVST